MKQTSSLRINPTLKALILGACAFTAASFAAASGCVEQPNKIGSLTSGAGPTGGSSSSGGSDAGSPKAEELFAGILPDLLTNCGICHEPGGAADTPFLAGPNYYQSLVSWPGIVVKDPTQSLFLTHAVKGGGHGGTNLDADTLVESKLKERVTAWLTEEAKAIAEPPPEVGPAIDPFTPILGFNAVYLGPLGNDFDGMAITFNAEELGDSSLALTQIEMHTTSKLGVHIVHPLFVVFPVGAEPDPDPIDSYSNLDQSFDPGGGGPLNPNTLVLTNWKAKAKLSVAFEAIEKIDPGANDGGMDGGTFGCKDVAAFKANAEPQFTQRCKTCHGGSNGGATGAVDMTQLGNDSAAACAQILYRVNVMTPANSQIFITTDPNGNAAHPFKFGGIGANFQAFKDAVTPWIVAEQ